VERNNNDTSNKIIQGMNIFVTINKGIKNDKNDKRRNILLSILSNKINLEMQTYICLSLQKNGEQACARNVGILQQRQAGRHTGGRQGRRDNSALEYEG
jgi:hypothetical protein